MKPFHRQHATRSKPVGRGRWRQFSMRGLFIAITLAGVALGWGHWARRQHEAVTALEKSNPSASVYYDYETDSRGGLVDSAATSGIAWLHDRRRVDFFCAPSRVDISYATDADLACLRRLPNLRRLTLERSIDLTDAGLKHLLSLRHLKTLAILDGQQITDAGLRHLEGISSLEELRLDVASARVTRAAIERLKRALPNCRIEISDGDRRVGDFTLQSATRRSPFEPEFLAG